MHRILKKLSLVTLVLVFAAKAASAQTFGSFTAYPKEGVILLNGAIEVDSPDSFIKALEAVEDAKSVVLQSPGGVVAAALEIAKSIHDLDLVTVVEEGQYCASACSILFFSGKQRVALGELGVHQMSAPGRGNLAGVQLVLADVLSAFDAYGVDDRVMQKMLRTSSDDMYYFTDEQKIAWGIDRFTEPESQSAPMSFAAFPPDRYYSGSGHLPDFQGRDEWARNFRTRIRDSVNSGANFAGHYSVVEIGCGTFCRFAFVTDVATGEVFSFPYGGEEQYQLGLVYSLDSRLLRATWMMSTDRQDSASKDICASQDLLWNGANFEIVRDETFEIEKFGICSIEY